MRGSGLSRSDRNPSGQPGTGAEAAKKANIPSPDLLARLDVSAPEFVAHGLLATIWKVRRADGEPAALKLYPGDDMQDDAPGFRLQAALAGRGMPRLLACEPGAALIEWLEGPSLGDLTRGGRDGEAMHRLVGVANRIHAARVRVTDLPRLEDWFGALFDLKLLSGCSASARRDVARAQALARKLLDHPRDVTPMHGDLHHDNIRMGPHGYVAFDAKGVLGERGYELANAFRNPEGADPLIRQPQRIDSMADLWSREFGVPRGRLLSWAAVKVGLSIAWNHAEGLADDPELDLLAIFLALAEGGAASREEIS